jgi:hypothetical protein
MNAVRSTREVVLGMADELIDAWQHIDKALGD